MIFSLTLSVPHETREKQYFHAKNTHILGIHKMSCFWQFHPVFKNVSFGRISKDILINLKDCKANKIFPHLW
eukprot:UN23478